MNLIIRSFVTVMAMMSVSSVSYGATSAGREKVRKIVMISLENCKGCKKMLPLLHQVAARSRGKLIIEVKMYGQAQQLLKDFNVGHIDVVPHILVFVDNVLVQQIPFSSSLHSADTIWNVLNKQALDL